jgi:hypothetical protein
VWTACGRKRGNFAVRQKRKKLCKETSHARTYCAAGCAFGKTLIQIGKPELSTEIQGTC